MTIGDIIKNRRKALRMTQEDLAKAVGTTKATVCRWESGNIKKIDVNRIQKVSNVLQLDPQLFFQRTEVLLPEEYDVIIAFRNADNGTRSAVKKLLDLSGEEKNPALDSLAE